MKLYWSSRSPFVRKVMVVAHELGLSDRITCEAEETPGTYRSRSGERCRIRFQIADLPAIQGADISYLTDQAFRQLTFDDEIELVRIRCAVAWLVQITA